MKVAHTLSYSVENPILVEHFTRLKQVVEGIFAPDFLPGLPDYLANAEGEIHYRLEGSQSHDGFDSKAGGKMRVKCIITGCIFIFDTDGEPLAHELEITNHWVLVRSEQDLPALEEESDDEDFVVSGAVLDVPTLVAEEVILDLPMTAMLALPSKPVKHDRLVTETKETESKLNPFAKLAELKSSKN
jgi:hypothetical protein